MKKIEAIIKPYVLEDVKTALGDIGLMGMTVSEVRGYTGGRPPCVGAHPMNGKSVTAYPAAATAGEASYPPLNGFTPYDDFVPSLKLEIVVRESMMREAVDIIVHAGQLRNFAAGELVVHSLVDVVRIRTEEHLEQAI